MKTLFLSCLIVLLSACAAGLDDYKGVEPKLDLRQYFNGHLIAHGMIQDRSGKVIRRFEADIFASWQGDRGVLDEVFRFDDGEIQTRCWRLQAKGDNYTGTAGDVLGQAQGKVSGNALNWQYDLQIQVDGKPMSIHLNDWLYLLDQQHLLNKAEMTKYGFKVGEITLFIRKLSNSYVPKTNAICSVGKVLKTN